MKQSVTGDCEPYFIFVVPVFAIELRQHALKTSRVWGDIDYVCGDVATASFQLFNFVGISAKNFFCCSIGGNRIAGLPSFIFDVAGL